MQNYNNQNKNGSISLFLYYKYEYNKYVLCIDWDAGMLIKMQMWTKQSKEKKLVVFYTINEVLSEQKSWKTIQFEKYSTNDNPYSIIIE